jgi:4-hydroxybenzoyl-CoA reductase subunit beta
MVLPPFRLHQPRSLAEALELLARHGDEARLLAGGTDLVVNLRQRLETPAHVIALGRVGELRPIRREPDGGLWIGALALLEELAREPAVLQAFPLLTQAAASVSGPTLRSMGTLGGNLCLDTRCWWFNQSYDWRRACGFCLKKDGEVCHVARSSPICVAAYSGDLAPALMALGAEIVVRSARGKRELPLADFYLEDGMRRLNLARDELLAEVRLPAAAAGLAGRYAKLRARGSIDYPLAGVAAAGRTRHGVFEEVAVALTAVGPRPYLVAGIGELLEGQRSDDEEAIEEAALRVQAAAAPLSTGGAYSPFYRRLRLRLLARDALKALGDSASA